MTRGIALEGIAVPAEAPKDPSRHRYGHVTAQEALRQGIYYEVTVDGVDVSGRCVEFDDVAGYVVLQDRPGVERTCVKGRIEIERVDLRYANGELPVVGPQFGTIAVTGSRQSDVAWRSVYESWLRGGRR